MQWHGNAWEWVWSGSAQEAEEVVPALEDAADATPSLMRLESRKKKFTMKARAVPGFHRQSLDIFRAYVLNGWNVLNALNILMCVADSSRVWCYELCGYHCEWMYASVSVRQCEEQSEGDPRAQYVKVLVKHGITPVPWLLWCWVFELSCLPACFWAINVSWVRVVVQCRWILLVRRARSSTQFCSDFLTWNNFLFCISFNLKLLRSFGRLAS